MSPTLRKEATQVDFNTHTAWILKFTIREVRDIFGHRTPRTRDNPASILSRPIIPSHQTTIEKYLAENEDWIFDTITLATPKGSILQSSKIITLDQDQIAVLDGQHRLNAILSFLSHLEQNAPTDRSNKTQNRLNALMRDELPFILHEVNSQQDQQLLFQLFSNRRPFDPADPRQQPDPFSSQDPTPEPTHIETEPETGPETPEESPEESPDHSAESEQPATNKQAQSRISLGGLKGIASSFTRTGKNEDRQPDPFETAAQAATEQSNLLINRVHSQRKTGQPNTPLLTPANIKEVATTIHLGINRVPSADDRTACRQPNNQTELQQSLITFFDHFLPTCVPNYHILADPDNLDDLIITSRSHSYALEPPVIRLIANVWARWTIDYDLPPAQLARHIGSLKMAKADPLNDIETSFNVVQGQQKRFQTPRHNSWEKATANIIESAQSRPAATPKD